MTVSFDTLSYSKSLTKAGEKPEVAEVHALTLKALVDDDLVTKSHLDTRIEILEKNLTIKIGGMLAVAVGVLAVLIKVL